MTRNDEHHAPHHAHQQHAHTHDHSHGHGDNGQMDWAKMGPLLERGAEVYAPLYRQAAAWLGELAPASGVRRILDVGSGPGVIAGLLAEAFPEAEVVAVDATPELLERARARAERLGYGGRFATIEAELPGGLDALGTADVIWAGDSLHHVGDQRGALADLGGLLRPGGVVALVEGGLPARHLPRDIGMGRPGLEVRLDAANAERFEAMRAALPGTKEEVEDWRALLGAAGLAPTGARSFLLDVPAPAPAQVREHLAVNLAHRRSGSEEFLSEDDLAVLTRLADPDDPAGVLNRADVFLLAARTVHTARRA
ncbi:class I SAM-dependent methyltransferase [Streptomyces sp. NPDC047315]|uniref:class I SAM-dependent methyltransferase n=1 Tax=Streptomyces sp. NPDC047315 TaxID=3155142 RepID=UPI0033E32614